MKEEAKELWSDFLESVSVIETDNKYAPVLKVYKDTADFRAGYYEKVTGNSKSEYLDMSTFEQFLWYSTYIFPVNATTASGYETYFGSLAKWNSNVAGNDYNLLKNQGATEQAQAYRTLMEWQYNFFLQTGSMYNFITEKTSVEDSPNYIIPAL